MPSAFRPRLLLVLGFTKIPCTQAIASIGRSSPTVANVVFTLVQGGDDGAVFIEQNKCIRRALATGDAYDLVAFHEGNARDMVMAHIRAATPGIRFFDVSEHFGSIPEQVALPSSLDPRAVGYRHMW